MTLISRRENLQCFLLKDSFGFTLIEVMVSLAILSSLALLTSQSITQAVKSKKKIERMVGRSGLLRDALQVIKKDINRAFHYYDINVDLYNQSQMARINNCKKSAAKGTNPNSWPTKAFCNKLQKSFKKRKQKNLTQFQGYEDRLNFTSLSHIRPKKDSKFSRQSEVGYFVKSCKGRLDKGISSECLWRRMNPIIDNEVEEGGRAVVLLENISEFKLRYLGPEKDGGELWVKTWKTGENADDLTRGRFPSAVEITLVLEDEKSSKKKKKKKVSFVTVTSIRFPNNAQ